MTLLAQTADPTGPSYVAWYAAAAVTAAIAVAIALAIYKPVARAVRSVMQLIFSEAVEETVKPHIDSLRADLVDRVDRAEGRVMGRIDAHTAEEGRSIELVSNKLDTLAGSVDQLQHAWEAHDEWSRQREAALTAGQADLRAAITPHTDESEPGS